MEFGSSYYKLKAKHSGKVMAVAGGGTSGGTWVVQWDWTGGDEQMFRLEPLAGGYYALRPKTSLSSVVAIGASATNNGAYAVLWPWTGGAEQRFKIEADGDHYALRAAHSGQALSIGAGSTMSGARVIQWPDGRGVDQRWSITRVPMPAADTLEIWAVPTDGLPDHADHTWVRCPQAYDDPARRANSAFGCWLTGGPEDHIRWSRAAKVTEADGYLAHAIACEIRRPTEIFGTKYEDTAGVGAYGLNGVCHQSANLFLAAAGGAPMGILDFLATNRPKGLWFSYLMWGTHGSHLPMDAARRPDYYASWRETVLEPVRARLLGSTAADMQRDEQVSPALSAAMLARDEALRSGETSPEKLQALQFSALADVAAQTDLSGFTDTHRRLLVEKNERIAHDWNGNPAIGEALADRMNELAVVMQKELDSHNHAMFMQMSGNTGQNLRLVDPRIAHDGSRVIVVGAGDPPPAGRVKAPFTLMPGERLASPNGLYRLTYQTDGNLVLYKGTTALWSTNTAGRSAGRTVFQEDGNFVVYDGRGGAVWANGKYGGAFAGSTLYLQDDGNLVEYDRSERPVWATNTHGR